MVKNTIHIYKISHILLLLGIVFSLSPCPTKESVYELFNLEYTKPLNKTKTTQKAESSCSNSFQIESEIKNTKSTKENIIAKHTNEYQLTNNLSLINTEFSSFNLSKFYSPPLYILYSSLKICCA